MNKDARNANWVFFLFFLAFAAGLAGTRPMRAEEKKPDLAAEKKKEAEEAAKQAADRLAGNEGGFQRHFSGTFILNDSSQQDNPDVVGIFVTDAKDQVPQQGYQVRVAKGAKEKEILETLKRYNGKKVEVQGRLRVDNKYLVVSGVIERAAPPKEPERRAGGGI
jgi:hypothetical protein